MKTYNQFITELNKFELAMKAGKLGLKTLKKIGLKSVSKKVPVKDIIKFRSNPKNPFTSQMRSAENKTVDHLKKIGKVQRDNPTLSNNPAFDVPKDFTSSRHKGFRRLSKKKQSRYFKAGVGFKPSDPFSKDANALLDVKPAPGLNKYSGDAMISRQFNTNRLGKPTTKGIKKGSIPEPKK
tara:strand:+ start:361 stop:903 length:543 start_codon:yes stop_codon:yes gene_type:complete